jgi:ABC-type Na+ efflux pump permease subunit
VTAPAVEPRERWDWGAMRAVIAKDLVAVKRSKLIMIPMIAVPALLLVVLPLVLGLFAHTASPDEVGAAVERLGASLPAHFDDMPPEELVFEVVLGFLLAPLFLIVPLMVSAVLAADAFAGEKERKTLEGLMHLPIGDRDLFVAKVIGAFVPAVLISWIGFVCFAVIANGVAWPAMHRIFVPTRLWAVMILWVAPAVAMFGLGVMVRVSARAKTTQEATQLGGAVILPLIFLALGQASGILLLDIIVGILIGLFAWVVALVLVWRGANRFTRERLAKNM